MPFCPPCKIIIDNGHAAIAAIGCMQGSVTLGAAAGLVPPEELRKPLVAALEAAALAAQDLAGWYPK